MLRMTMEGAMNAIVERVAAAIWDAWDWSDDAELEDFNAVAVAAITAMREPTEAMVKDKNALAWSYSCAGDDATEGCWQSLIDTALKD
jgi:hypothetical protein